MPKNVPPKSYANFLDDLNEIAKPKTGLYCGSFNPIHNAHVALCRYLLGAGYLNNIFLVVSPRNPFKQQKDLMKDDLRLELARLAVKDMDGVEVSDIEMSLPRPSYTINTILKLKSIYPGTDFVLVMGADNLERFSAWKDYEKILSEVEILAFRRPGCDIDKCSFSQIRIVDNPLMDVSATEIRRRLSCGESIDDLVCPEVASRLEEIIKREGIRALFY